MGKALIKQSHGEGLYTVEVMIARERIEAQIAQINARIVQIDESRGPDGWVQFPTGELPEAWVAYNEARFETDGAIADLNEYLRNRINDLNFETNLALQNLITQEDLQLAYDAFVSPALVAFQAKAIRAAVNRDLLWQRIVMLQAELTSLMLRRSELEAVPENETRQVWCADYTLFIFPGAEVGTIEINGEPEAMSQRILIKPGFTGVGYTPSDGQLHTRIGQAYHQAFLNAALLPGWQRHRPTFRTAVINSIEADNKCNLTLDPAFSSAQNLPINGAENLTNVPIEYMHCHATAFEAGDHVVVQLTGWDWDEAKVIGFVSNPKTCLASDFIVNSASGRYQLTRDGEGWSASPTTTDVLSDGYWRGATNDDVVSWGRRHDANGVITSSQVLHKGIITNTRAFWSGEFISVVRHSKEGEYHPIYYYIVEDPSFSGLLAVGRRQGVDSQLQNTGYIPLPWNADTVAEYGGAAKYFPMRPDGTQKITTGRYIYEFDLVAPSWNFTPIPEDTEQVQGYRNVDITWTIQEQTGGGGSGWSQYDYVAYWEAYTRNWSHTDTRSFLTYQDDHRTITTIQTQALDFTETSWREANLPHMPANLRQDTLFFERRISIPALGINGLLIRKSSRNDPPPEDDMHVHLASWGAHASKSVMLYIDPINPAVILVAIVFTFTANSPITIGNALDDPPPISQVEGDARVGGGVFSVYASVGGSLTHLKSVNWVRDADNNPTLTKRYNSFNPLFYFDEGEFDEAMPSAYKSSSYSTSITNATYAGQTSVPVEVTLRPFFRDSMGNTLISTMMRPQAGGFPAGDMPHININYLLRDGDLEELVGPGNTLDLPSDIGFREGTGADGHYRPCGVV